MLLKPDTEASYEPLDGLHLLVWCNCRLCGITCRPVALALQTARDHEILHPTFVMEVSH